MRDLRQEHRMQLRWTLLALAASLLCVPAASGLAEFGIEGMGVVSTPANEARATLSPDGQRIVWASDRAGGSGGWDLWQARLSGGRWQNAEVLPINTAQDETSPLFSADGRWLLFASTRPGGAGGADLYRAPVDAQGRIGAVQSLGAAINSRGDERSPTLSLDARACCSPATATAAPAAWTCSWRAGMGRRSSRRWR
ncbi:hypothetical protein XPR_3452 [Xanthomonas arboricola pv. pruni MAFF 301420]|uniref:TolB-like protein n=1 Tax=Xanthomonas arboricola pv. pruni MAFF 301420 TaxID=1418095 RepID=W4SK97_9XANT|nr:hypothetical protein XPR_3452 [Xanthomonas arboricola pv. pruni MAFF 301420]